MTSEVKQEHTPMTADVTKIVRDLELVAEGVLESRDLNASAFIVRQAATTITAQAAENARLIEALRASEWQPIETVPKGEVLLYYPPITNAAHPSNNKAAWVTIGMASSGHRKASHWRALPAHPATEAGE